MDKSAGITVCMDVILREPWENSTSHFHGMVYRQWRLLGQPDNTSASGPEQLARWTVFLDKWEKALQEDKEVIVIMDANIDHLTWRMNDSLPPHSSSFRLKSLIDALFTRIIPMGVTQLVTGATRMERGQPRTGLDARL